MKLLPHDHPLSFVVVGHVDHGKSTLVGRLLFDTDSLPEGKSEELIKAARRRGGDAIEWSYLLDAFQAERDQNITIDMTHIQFKTVRRRYVIIDAPGHREFLRNMVSGAATADAAVLVVDAHEGLREQSRRHAYILHLLGIRQVVLVVNKMDLAGYDPEIFHQVKADMQSYLGSFGIVPVHAIPVVARDGDMVASRSGPMDWYEGPTLCEALDSLDVLPLPVAVPLRFPVQDVYKFGDERVVVGRVESGMLRQGDTIVVSPTGEKAQVTSLRVWPEDRDKVVARAGEAVGFTLDQNLYIERGHVISHEENLPVLSSILRATVFWLSAQPLQMGNSYTLRCGTHQCLVTVQAIERAVDTQDLSRLDPRQDVGKGMVAEIILRSRDRMPVDTYGEHVSTGRIVLSDGMEILGGGILHMDDIAAARRPAAQIAANLFAVSHLVSYQDRIRIRGHQGAVFWLTGLSGAGKSTLAMILEKELIDRGYGCYVLDGDNVRRGLCADLGFSIDDRAENIRRVGEVAALMSDAGMIVITSFISPFSTDRARARASASGRFHEIYVKADIAECERRDPKGLYRKARAGEIRDFTGIDSPYEIPDDPDLVIDTAASDIGDCVRKLLDYICHHISLKEEQENHRAF
ncbi:MAG: adenylyl-sulfate kinase [Micavibrio aeruginosavorus]|uniref:Adenylyl-sulfate kinase n=1 Tax=Micavibrio aeruginosavorus TaxID=349221 RepID=A0A7T5R3S1_9BACT|nr:MAG: adenylyl-sulfate kinase [Micavibrio aeruginosavorus]